MVYITSVQGGKKYYYGDIQGPYGGAVDDNVRRDNRGVEHMKYWWTPQNPGSPFKELFRIDPVGNNRYFQRSHVRLQDVSLSYRFDSSLTKKLKIDALSVYVSGRNLYVWTKWLGLDPSSPSTSNDNTGYGFVSDYPLLRNYTFGVNVSF